MRGVTHFLLPEILEILDERVTINLTEDTEDSENFQSQNGNSYANRQRVVLVRTINHADQTMNVLDQAYSIVAHFNPATIERIKKEHGYKSLSLLKGGVLRITKYHFSTPARCFANRKQKRPQRSVTARSHHVDEYRIALWVDDFSVIADDELAVSYLPHIEENAQVTRLLKTMGHNELDTTLLRRQGILPSPLQTETGDSSATTSPTKLKQYSDSNPLLDEDCEIPEDQEDALNQVEGWGHEVEKTDSQLIEENGHVPMSESQGIGTFQTGDSHFQQENVKMTFIQCSSTDTEEELSEGEEEAKSTEETANKPSSLILKNGPEDEEKAKDDDEEKDYTEHNEPNSQSEIIYDDGMQYCTQQPDEEESQIPPESQRWHTQPPENSTNDQMPGKRVTFNLNKSPQKSITTINSQKPTKKAFAPVMDFIEGESQVQDIISAPSTSEAEITVQEEETHEDSVQENADKSEAEETQVSVRIEVANDDDDDIEIEGKSEPERENSRVAEDDGNVNSKPDQAVNATVSSQTLMQKVAAATSLLIDAGTAALQGLKRSHESAIEANVEALDASPKRHQRENSTAPSPDFGHDAPPSRINSSSNSQKATQEQARSANMNIEQRKIIARRNIAISESNSSSANSRQQASRRYEHLFPPFEGDLLKSLISARGR
jgi:hypothetical protein